MTRPGMADGRAFGINGYLDPCAYNANLQKKLKLTQSNSEYRAFLQTKSEEVMKMMNKNTSAVSVSKP